MFVCLYVQRGCSLSGRFKNKGHLPPGRRGSPGESLALAQGGRGRAPCPSSPRPVPARTPRWAPGPRRQLPGRRSASAAPLPGQRPSPRLRAAGHEAATSHRRADSRGASPKLHNYRRNLRSRPGRDSLFSPEPLARGAALPACHRPPPRSRAPAPPAALLRACPRLPEGARAQGSLVPRPGHPRPPTATHGKWLWPASPLPPSGAPREPATRCWTDPHPSPAGPWHPPPLLPSPLRWANSALGRKLLLPTGTVWEGGMRSPLQPKLVCAPGGGPQRGSCF